MIVRSRWKRRFYCRRARTGPAFLTPANYYVIKEYNFSDLYVLFVGHLSDLIAGGKPFETPWSKTAQLRTADVEAMQQKLTAQGFYKDKIDGKAGMLTRSALGAYQKANGAQDRLLADSGVCCARCADYSHHARDG